MSQLSYKIHFSLHVTIRLRNSSLLLCRLRGRFKTDFFELQSAHEAPLLWAFHLSSLLQRPNGRRTVDVESLGNFSVVVLCPESESPKQRIRHPQQCKSIKGFIANSSQGPRLIQHSGIRQGPRVLNHLYFYTDGSLFL